MAFHPDITRKDDVTVALDAANAAVRIASKQLTGNAGTVEIPNADGTSTIMGAGAGDTGVAPWVGDTIAPGKPLGITAESHNGAVWVSWDGTLDGGVPADFDHVRFTAVDGSKTVDMGQLKAAGKVTAAELTAGDTVTITAVAYDDAHAADGSSAPNASVVSDPVTVVVKSAVDAAVVQKAHDDAQSALDQAGQASAAATSAQTTADGKNKIFSAASEPAHTGLVPGDLWFQLDSSSHVTGIQVWSGSAFVDYLIVANEILVAGSVGTTQIKNGAITTDLLTANAVTAIKIAAQTITGDKLDVGSVAAAIVRSNQFVTDDGLKGFDSDNGYWIKDAEGNYLFHANTDGNIEMQDAVMKGGDVTIGDPLHGQIHLGGQANDLGTIDFINNNSTYAQLQSHIYDNKVYLTLTSGGVHSLNFIYDEQTHKHWALFEGTIYTASLDDLPTELALGSEKGSIAFAGGVRYVYDGNGSWQEYDTRVVSTNLTDFFTPASGFSEMYPKECAFIISDGMAHVTFSLTGTLPNNTYTVVGTLKEGYRPIRYVRICGPISGGYTYGGWTNTAGVVNVGNRTGADRTWFAVDCTFQLA